jgi:hypothetical protein
MLKLSVTDLRKKRLSRLTQHRESLQYAKQEITRELIEIEQRIARLENTKAWRKSDAFQGDLEDERVQQRVLDGISSLTL